jgi:hypothetical protein
MTETPRERWTISNLDKLNHEAMRRLTQLDQAVRDIRVDIKGLAGGTYYGSGCPVIRDGLTWGEGWTDERIDDLRGTVTDGVKNLHGDIRELRDEVEALTSKSAIRHSRRTWAAGAAFPLNRPWTDGRLDDFNHRLGVDLAQLECDVLEIQSQVRGLRIKSRFHTRWDARLGLWRLALAAALYGLAISFLVSRAAHGS